MLNKREDIEIDKESSWIVNQAFQSPGQADKELWEVHSELFHVRSELLGLSAMLSCQVAAGKNSVTSVDSL